MQPVWAKGLIINLQVSIQSAGFLSNDGAPAACAALGNLSCHIAHSVARRQQHLPTKCSICGKYLAEPLWSLSALVVQVWKTSSWADLHTDVNSKHQRVWQTQDGEPGMLAADAVTHPVTWHESEIIRWHDSDSVNSNDIIEEAATKTHLFYSSLMDSAVGSTAFWEVQLPPLKLFPILAVRTVDIKYQVLFAEELLLASIAWQNLLT